MLKNLSHILRSRSLENFKTDTNFDDFKKYDNSETSFYRTRNISESSVDVFVVNDTDSDEDVEEGHDVLDNGMEDKGHRDDVFTVLEQKVEKLSDLFIEQSELLATIKNEIRSSKITHETAEIDQSRMLVEILNEAVDKRSNNVKNREIKSVNFDEDGKTLNSRARSLLDAIELRQGISLDREIMEALTRFLQSEELRDHIVAKTVLSLKSMVRGWLSRDLSRLYTPLLQRSHARLCRHLISVLERAFYDLEMQALAVPRRVHHCSATIRNSLDSHQRSLHSFAHDYDQDLYNDTITRTIEDEMKNYKEKMKGFFSKLDESSEEEQEEKDRPTSPLTPLEFMPPSPPQPADLDVSVIDQLMKSAEIAKLSARGEIDGAFSLALSSQSLALVAGVCRSSGPTAFAKDGHCRLAQPVLLALLQQLATDMLHDTQLKCRYMEESLINLDISDPVTKSNLPLVAADVCSHLRRFLASYPAHYAARRVKLILMALDNLLK